MQIISLKTKRIEAFDDLYTHLELALSGKINENIVIVISSKIVALCEGSVIEKGVIEKDTLIKSESKKYIERDFVPGSYVMHTFKNHMILPSAGIDESNTGKYFCLLPKDPFVSAKEIYEWIQEKYNIDNFGVIISDSHSLPLRRGVIGYCLGFYGFNPINSYKGSDDLFGKKMHVSETNIADGIAVAANVSMGEGQESTPITLVSNIQSIEFTTHYTKEDFYIKESKDIYMPFFNAAPWKKNQE